MKKIYFIIILGILLVGTITASILITSREKISDVNTLSGDLMCEELQKQNIESYNRYCVKEVTKGKQIILEPILITSDVLNLNVELVKLNDDKIFYEVKSK